MKITVNKCPYTGKLFESDEEFKAHIRSYKIAQKAARHANELNNWLRDEKNAITSPEQIPGWIANNFEKLKEIHNLKSSNWDKMYPSDSLEYISMDLKYSKTVSNTHCCPKNGVMNFRWLADLPRGYPGYHGTINVNLKRADKYLREYPISSFLKMLDIYTGTGGGANSDSSYGVSIFLDDWPGMSEQVLTEILSGNGPNPAYQHVTWSKNG